MEQEVRYRINADQVLAMCADDGDCLIWRGIRSDSGVPKINVYVGHGNYGRTVMSARRVLWELLKGEIPAKRYVTTNRGHPSCMNPDHLVLTTRAKTSKAVAARPDVKAKKAASQRGEKSHRAKLTPEQVSDIKGRDDDYTVIARDYAVSASGIGKIKRGETWADLSNPFLALCGG